jgi:hypothetical protein
MAFNTPSGLARSIVLRNVFLALVAVSLLGFLFTSRERIHDTFIRPNRPLEIEEPFEFIAEPTPEPSVDVRKVIGLVFYGRREFVSILQCYLQVRSPCYPCP